MSHVLRQEIARALYERSDLLKLGSYSGAAEALLPIVRKHQAEAWDMAVASMAYEDGTPCEIVSVVNPYRNA